MRNLSNVYSAYQLIVSVKIYIKNENKNIYDFGGVAGSFSG